MSTNGTINKKIVVIDDEPSVQEVVRGYLEKDATSSSSPATGVRV